MLIPTLGTCPLANALAVAYPDCAHQPDISANWNVFEQPCPGVTDHA